MCIGDAAAGDSVNRTGDLVTLVAGCREGYLDCSRSGEVGEQRSGDPGSVAGSSELEVAWTLAGIAVGRTLVVGSPLVKPCRRNRKGHRIEEADLVAVIYRTEDDLRTLVRLLACRSFLVGQRSSSGTGDARGLVDKVASDDQFTEVFTKDQVACLDSVSDRFLDGECRGLTLDRLAGKFCIQVGDLEVILGARFEAREAEARLDGVEYLVGCRDHVGIVALEGPRDDQVAAGSILVKLDADVEVTVGSDVLETIVRP